MHSIILISHNKPKLVHEAIASVLRQTYSDFEFIIIDSGALFEVLRDAYGRDNRVVVINSMETVEIRTQNAMAPYLFNMALKNHVSGETVSYLCDDDLLYKDAFRTFVEYMNAHEKVLAAYARLDLQYILPGGGVRLMPPFIPKDKLGKCCNGLKADGVCDMLQLVHRRKLLDLMPEWWPTSKQTESHADGVFLERIGEITPVEPIRSPAIGVTRRSNEATYGANYWLRNTRF